MAKKITYDNLRVEIPLEIDDSVYRKWLNGGWVPRAPWEIADALTRQGQSFITDSIPRGVSADVEFDVLPVCSFCGAQWTEDSEVFNGGCCDKDMENDPNPEPADTIAEEK